MIHLTILSMNIIHHSFSMKKKSDFMNSHHSPTIKVPIKVPIRVTVNPNQGHGPGPGEIGVSRMEGFSAGRGSWGSVIGLFGRFHGGFLMI
jgi:hypothetical protein